MDASQSALDSLRTVEFRETLKGYHRDDVDEYLEKAAVEAEGLQEQLRQNCERLRKAAETIAQLETELAAKAQAPLPAGRRPSRPWPTTPCSGPCSSPRSSWTRPRPTPRPRPRAGPIADGRGPGPEGPGRVRADACARRSTRLESNRGHLSHEVETMARQLETERERLRDGPVRDAPLGGRERLPASGRRSPTSGDGPGDQHLGRRPRSAGLRRGHPAAASPAASSGIRLPS